MQSGWLLSCAFFLSCSLDSAKKNYILAEKLWADEKYNEAVVEFEKVIKRDPRGALGAQALYRAAVTQTLFLGEHVEAIEKFQQYIETVGASQGVEWQAQLEIGEILFSKLRRHREAIRHYEGLLRRNPPQSDEFMYRIGQSRFALGEYESAIDDYGRVRRQWPQSPWSEKAAYQIAATYLAIADRKQASIESEAPAYQRAIQAFEAFLKEFPESAWAPQARFGIASCYEELDQLEAAHAQYEKIADTYPSPNVIQIKLIRIEERMAKSAVEKPSERTGTKAQKSRN